MTAVALTIATDGRVLSCTVETSSGHEVLDRTTCDLLTARARFTPARDVKGRPISATRRQRVKWTMPAAVEMSIGDRATTYTLTLGPDGTVQDCKVSSTGEFPPDSTPDVCGGFGEPAGEIVEIMRSGADDQIVTVQINVIETLSEERRLGALIPTPGWKQLMAASATFQISEDGWPRNCKIEKTMGDERLLFSLCEMVSGQRYQRPSPPDGKAQPSLIGIAVSVSSQYRLKDAI